MMLNCIGKYWLLVIGEMMLKAVILDIDGVILLGKTQISGAADAIGKLRKMSMKVFFLSNNASRSRKSLAQKLTDAGVPACEGECYPASYGVANYLAEKYPGLSVYSISTGGMEKELERAGLKISKDEKADIVAVGFDTHITYGKLATAFRALMNGAIFVASNEDKTFPVEDGLKPGTGAIVGALRFSTDKKPIVVGKPNTYMLKMIMREHGLKKDEVVMVGDRFDMDIAMAKKAGIKSVLVLSGVANREDVKKNGKLKPDLVLKCLADLPAKISELQE